MAETDRSVLWRRLDRAGHESARVRWEGVHWQLTGTAVFAHDRQACRLDYLIVCDADWRTLSGRVAGWIGSDVVEVEVAADSARRWRLNKIECPAVEGSIDLDLNFSPSTNLLPIRRLRLAVGQEARVLAAWLCFPSFSLEPLEQLYRRIDARTYRYESASGRFVAELRVDEDDFVTSYPQLWRIEA